LRLKKVEDDYFEITRIVKPDIDYNKHTVNVDYTIFVKDKINNFIVEFFEIHPMRHFSYNEILLFAKITGFDIVKFEEFLTETLYLKILGEFFCT
jgi:hypothetical protein